MELNIPTMLLIKGGETVKQLESIRKSMGDDESVKLVFTKKIETFKFNTKLYYPAATLSLG